MVVNSNDHMCFADGVTFYPNTPKIKSKTNLLIIGVPSEGYCPGCSIFYFLCSVLQIIVCSLSSAPFFVIYKACREPTPYW
jgi:hypothetical protein